MPQIWDPDIHLTGEDAAQLIERQFPELAPTRLTLLGVGWDNAAFLVNQQFVFRFPRRTVAANLLEREVRILPLLAPHLPLPISSPVYAGAPSAGYPYHFAGYPLVPGRTADQRFGGDRERAALAPALARFLRALHDIPIDDATRAWAPGDELARTDIPARAPKATERLAANPAGLAASLIQSVLARIKELSAAYLPPSRSCWVHGDLYGRHIMLDDSGQIAGVIDWGDVHIGDPATDLSIAFSLLPPFARPLFREIYGPIDTATWDRARFRAIYYGAMLTAYGADSGDLPIKALGEYALGAALV